MSKLPDVARFLIVFFFAAASLVPEVAKSEEYFQRANLGNGISLEYPKKWVVLDKSLVSDIAMGANESLRSAGIDTSDFSKDRRLVLESNSKSPRARIRVSFVSPAEFSQADLAAATEQDLRAIEAEFKQSTLRAAASSSVKPVSFGPVRISRVEKHLALVIPYERRTEPDPEVWVVEQYKIPVGTQYLSLTLSYQKSYSPTYKQVMARVANSLRFNGEK